MPRRNSYLSRTVHALLALTVLLGSVPAFAQSETPAGKDAGTEPLKIALKIKESNGVALFQLDVTNTTDKKQLLEFATAQRYDFQVKETTSGNVIWKWSDDESFLPEGQTKTLNEGETWSFTEAWYYKETPAGDYQAVGMVTAKTPAQSIPAQCTFLLPIRLTLTVTENKGAAELAFEIKNIDTESHTIKFDTDQMYDFVVKDKTTDKPVWQWSTGRKFEGAPAEKTVNPGETLTFNEIWAWQGSKSIPAGQYAIEAILTSNPPIPSAAQDVPFLTKKGDEVSFDSGNGTKEGEKGKGTDMNVAGDGASGDGASASADSGGGSSGGSGSSGSGSSGGSGGSGDGASAGSGGSGDGSADSSAGSSGDGGMGSSGSSDSSGMGGGSSSGGSSGSDSGSGDSIDALNDGGSGSDSGSDGGIDGGSGLGSGGSSSGSSSGGKGDGSSSPSGDLGAPISGDDGGSGSGPSGIGGDSGTGSGSGSGSSSEGGMGSASGSGDGFDFGVSSGSGVSSGGSSGGSDSIGGGAGDADFDPFTGGFGDGESSGGAAGDSDSDATSGDTGSGDTMGGSSDDSGTGGPTLEEAGKSDKFMSLLDKIMAYGSKILDVLKLGKEYWDFFKDLFFGPADSASGDIAGTGGDFGTGTDTAWGEGDGGLSDGSAGSLGMGEGPGGPEQDTSVSGKLGAIGTKINGK